MFISVYQTHFKVISQRGCVTIAASKFVSAANMEWTVDDVSIICVPVVVSLMQVEKMSSNLVHHKLNSAYSVRTN